MSLPLRSSFVPQCASCTRRLANSVLREWRPSQQQVRGKKKLAKAPSTITVRLLKDVPSFGRKDALVPVSVGQMRNAWFPRRVAAYVTAPEMKTLRVRNVAMERNFEFGSAIVAKSKEEQEITTMQELAQMAEQNRREAPRVEVERITPERSIELLSILLPTRLDFYRQPNDPTPPTQTSDAGELDTSDSQQRQRQRQRSVSSAASDLLAARTHTPLAQTGSRPIFGSVSSADVALVMRAILAENDEAARVVFGEEDVRFLNVKEGDGEAAETDRVKFLGEYTVEVRIRGAEETIKRPVRVLAQET